MLHFLHTTGSPPQWVHLGGQKLRIHDSTASSLYPIHSALYTINDFPNLEKNIIYAYVSTLCTTCVRLPRPQRLEETDPPIFMIVGYESADTQPTITMTLISIRPRFRWNKLVIYLLSKLSSRILIYNVTLESLAISTYKRSRSSYEPGTLVIVEADFNQYVRLPRNVHLAL